jgi:peptidoglycan/LPS O-acetylase OafA/YrhL
MKLLAHKKYLDTEYRPDIDGLRSLAVIGVIIFHAFPEILTGGFLGVDIFFVISGYLITGIILKDIDNNVFSFKTFYFRRIRRIFPALIIILIFVLIFSYLILYPEEYERVSKHSLGGVFFVSNMVYANEIGYFDISSQLKPLLHLWSLSIEEQFYLFFPLILILCTTRYIRYFSIILFLISSSIIYSIYNNSVIFYSTASRAWELFSGCLLCYITRSNNRYLILCALYIDKLLNKSIYKVDKVNDESTLKNIASIIGIILLISSFIKINSSYVSSFLYFVPAISGTILLITGGPLAWVNKYILSNKVLVYIGLISYPLYLWHWPLLSFANIIDGGLSGIWSWRLFKIVCIIISLFLSILTYAFIEKLIRYRLKKNIIIVYSLIIIMICIGLTSYYIKSHDGYVKIPSIHNKNFTDRLYIRNKLSILDNLLNKLVIKAKSTVYKGKNDWIFFGSKNYIDKLTGNISNPILAELENNVSSINSLFNSIKINDDKKIVLIAPNKSTIYYEYLPDNIIIKKRKYIDIIAERLKKYNINFYSPQIELLGEKQFGKLLYYYTDSHWNNYGSYIAMIGLLKYLKFDEELIKQTFEGLSFSEGPQFYGDLLSIGKLDITPSIGDNFIISWNLNEPDLTIISSDGHSKKLESVSQLNTPKSNMPIRVLNINAKAKLTVWLFRDSFSTSLSPYFHAFFYETVHIYNKDKIVDPKIPRPDLVIYESVERSF